MQRINPTPVFKEREKNNSDKICKGSVCPLLAEASCCFSLNTARRVSSFYDPTLPAEINNKKKKTFGKSAEGRNPTEREKKKAKLGFTEACRGRLTRAHGGSDGAVSRRVRASSLPMKEVEIGVALAKKKPGQLHFLTEAAV